MYLKKHLPFFLLLLAGIIIVAVMIQPEQEVAEQETDSKAVMAEQGENIQETENVAAMSGNMSPGVQESSRLAEARLDELPKEELRQLLSGMFLDIVYHPENISQYEEILAEETIEDIEKYDWYYIEPEEIYNTATARIEEEGKTGFSFKVFVYADHPGKKLPETNGAFSPFTRREDGEAGLAFVGSYHTTANQIQCYIESWDSSRLQSRAQKRNLNGTWTLPEVKKGMTEKEIEESEELKELFIAITHNPEKISDYSNIFTEESLSVVEDVWWYYKKPEEVYDYAAIKVVKNLGGIKYRVFVWVDSQYDYETMQKMGIGTEYDEELKEKLAQEYVDSDIVDKVPVWFSTEYDPRAGNILIYHVVIGSY